MPLIYAHRGLHVSERENTIPAFRAARELGVDGVELDVRRTADNVLVVHHDATINDAPIALTIASALPDYVPTLAQAIDALDGVKVNVEIKNIKDEREPTYDQSGDFARQVLATLDDVAPSVPVIISSFDLATCALVRSIDVDIEVAWLLWSNDVVSAMQQAYVLGFNAVNPPFFRLGGAEMRRAKELSLDVNVWTVNEKADIEAMAALGVTSIISDNPALALSLVRS
jgi:glycerophosphoryl diester phosphodiesterase